MADNYFASVGVIMIRDRAVLLVCHTYGTAAGKLLNPGGYLRSGELPYAAAVREVMEETGVEVSPVGMLSLRCSAGGWCMALLVDYVSGEPRSDRRENSEALFMSCDELFLRNDATDTVKELVRLAVKVSPLPLTDAGKGRVMFSPVGD